MERPWSRSSASPVRAEWEFAARGGLELAPFPWGGPYIRNIYGCPLANFKPMRGDYVEDAGCHTVPIESYSPNDYGLVSDGGQRGRVDQHRL